MVRAGKRHFLLLLVLLTGLVSLGWGLSARFNSVAVIGYSFKVGIPGEPELTLAVPIPLPDYRHYRQKPRPAYADNLTWNEMAVEYLDDSIAIATDPGDDAADILANVEKLGLKDLHLMDGESLYAALNLKDEVGEEAAEDEGAEGFPMRILSLLKPMMRTYARIDTFRFPRLDFDVYQALQTDQERSAYAARVLIFGERTITALAILTALLVGLDRYFTTDFGSTADYLSLFTSGLVTKAGLEVANMVLSRLLPDN